jgi:RNase adaptor protein for sRNA GlmZ degradation
MNATDGDGAQVTTGGAGEAAEAIPELVIISGMSGAGRSHAAKCLEDLGWFVVDNLPPALIPTMVDLGARSQGNVARIAVVVDVRGRQFFDNLRESLADLEAKHVKRRVIFLEASDDALVRRFESVRRPHPLQGDGRIVDCRFLPNPHWIPELRPFTGTDEPVARYVFDQPGAKEFLDGYTELLRIITEGYRREGKRYLTLAVGCTGGKHRSVAMAERLAKRMQEDGVEAVVVHRDKGRE